MTVKNKISSTDFSVGNTIRTPFRCELDGGRGGMSVILYGIISIKDFSGDEVLMRTSGFNIRISGVGLTLSVYENKSVEIYGKILNMELIYDKN